MDSVAARPGESALAPGPRFDTTTGLLRLGFTSFRHVLQDLAHPCASKTHTPRPGWWIAEQCAPMPRHGFGISFRGNRQEAGMRPVAGSRGRTFVSLCHGHLESRKRATSKCPPDRQSRVTARRALRPTAASGVRCGQSLSARMHPHDATGCKTNRDRTYVMDWAPQLLPTVAAFLAQHAVFSAFALLLLEEAGVPLPVPGDILMLVVGVRVHQAHLVLWQALAAMEAATVIGSSTLYGISAHLGRPLAYRYGRLLRLSPERLARAEERIRSGGWRAIVVLRLVPGLRIATVVGCGLFGVPFRIFLPSLALGGFGYLLVFTLLGYTVGPQILAALASFHV